MTVGAGRRSLPTATVWGALESVGGCIVACDMLHPAYGCDMLPKVNLSLRLGSHWNLMRLTAWIRTWNRATGAQNPSEMRSAAAPGDVWTGSIESWSVSCHAYWMRGNQQPICISVNPALTFFFFFFKPLYRFGSKIFWKLSGLLFCL